MIIDSCQNKIRIVDESGKLIPYDSTLHRSAMLSFLLSLGRLYLEDMIWPDMPVIREESRLVIKQYLNYNLNEYINQITEAERATYEFAKMQLESSDLTDSLAEVLDSLIAEGKIQFATEDDVKASVEPAPITEEDFADLPLADSRHPLNNIKVEIK